MISGRPEIQTVNILLIGDSRVGKTSIIRQYSGKPFSNELWATLGLDFFQIKVRPQSNPNELLRVKVWDTAGQERYKSITMTFYKQSDGIMICFDLTSTKTFESVTRWLMQAQV